MHFSAGALALGRLLAGSVVLGLILLVRREGLPPRAAWPGILASGVLWFGVYMVALNWGEQLVELEPRLWWSTSGRSDRPTRRLAAQGGLSAAAEGGHGCVVRRCARDWPCHFA
jgi:hypothetical protein